MQDLESVFSKSQVGESFQLKARLGNHSQFQWALSVATSWTVDQDNPSQRLQKAGTECQPLNTYLVNSYLCFTCLGNSSQGKVRGESGHMGQHSGVPLLQSLPAGQRVGLLGVHFLGFRHVPDQVPRLSSHPLCSEQVWTVGQGPAAQCLQETPQAFSEHLLYARLGRLRSSGCSRSSLPSGSRVSLLG